MVNKMNISVSQVDTKIKSSFAYTLVRLLMWKVGAR